MMKTFILALALSFTSFCSAQFVSGDDKLHLGGGFVISSGTYTAVYLKTKNKKKAFWYSLGMSALAGATKECIDVGQDERFDTGEMVATTIGGLVASTTLSLFVGKKRNDKQKEVVLVN